MTAFISRRHQVSRENRNEIQARRQLETQLEPGEELLAYSGGIVGTVGTKPIYLGLTAERLILLKRGQPAGQVWNIWRENINSLEWSGIWDRLKVKLPKGQFSIACGKGYWKKRVKGLVEAHTEVPIPQHDDATMNERRLQQIKVFQELGLIASAQAVSEGVALSPGMESTVPASEMLAEKRLALKVGAVFLFINVGMMVLFSMLTGAGGGSLQSNLFVSTIIDVIIGINLWKGQAHQWVTWTIFRAALGFIVFGLAPLLFQGSSILEFLVQAAFCGSLILALTGEGRRNRTWISIGIFVIGFLGLFLASFVIAF